MLEFILIIIIAIGSVGAVAQGAPSKHKPSSVNQCVERIRNCVDSEDAPAAIEACQDPATRKTINGITGTDICQLVAIEAGIGDE